MIEEHKAGFVTMQQQLRDAAEIAAPGAEITFKAMFGGQTGYFEGRNFVSLSDVGLALKLPADVHNELLKINGAKRLQYEPDSPPSKQSIIVPSDLCADTASFAVWVGKSLAYVATLPLPKSRAKKTP